MRRRRAARAAPSCSSGPSDHVFWRRILYYALRGRHAGASWLMPFYRPPIPGAVPERPGGGRAGQGIWLGPGGAARCARAPGPATGPRPGPSRRSWFRVRSRSSTGRCNGTVVPSTGNISAPERGGMVARQAARWRQAGRAGSGPVRVARRERGGAQARYSGPASSACAGACRFVAALSSGSTSWQRTAYRFAVHLPSGRAMACARRGCGRRRRTVPPRRSLRAKRYDRFRHARAVSRYRSYAPAGTEIPSSRSIRRAGRTAITMPTSAGLRASGPSRSPVFVARIPARRHLTLPWFTLVGEIGREHRVPSFRCIATASSWSRPGPASSISTSTMRSTVRASSYPTSTCETPTGCRSPKRNGPAARAAPGTPPISTTPAWRRSRCDR